MFSLLWRVLTALGGLLWTFGLGMIAADLTGVGAGMGLLFGLADDVILVFFTSELSSLKVFALQVFLDETEKIVHETIIWSQEEDDQRDARHAALVRWHGDKIYLFGDVHLEDALLLWFSGGILAETSLVQSVFGLTAGEETVIL